MPRGAVEGSVMKRRRSRKTQEKIRSTKSEARNNIKISKSPNIPNNLDPDLSFGFQIFGFGILFRASE